MHDEIRYKAAAAVVALANRAESGGKKDSDDAKGAKWTKAPHDPGLSLDLGRLREAVAYLEIAESIFPAAAAHGYNRALLLETMGEWDGAIAAFLGMPGAGADDLGVRRCQAKKAGTYNELAFMGFSPEQIAAMEGDDDEDEADDDEPSAEARALEAEMAGKPIEEQLAMLMAASRARNAAPAAPTAAPAADPEEAAREQAAEVARTFVNHLLDRNYQAARAMLHPSEKGLGVDELREGFEPMFEGEEFPTSANVFDVRTEGPDLEKDDLAWTYVNIDSENVEAVCLIVTRGRQGELRVREVEFGRP